MRPVASAHEHGCLQASIASLLGLPTEGVPDFFSEDEGYWQAMAGWLKARGLWLTFTYDPADDAYGLGMMEGEHDDGTHGWHAVVTRGREIVHNPSGSQMEASDFPKMQIWALAVFDPAA